MDIVVADWDGVQDMTRVKECLVLLNEFYPGHDWVANCQDGSVWISTKQSANFGPYAYFINQKDITTPTTYRSLVKHGGGEFLERMHLIRGKCTYEDPKLLEGADPRHYKGFL